MAMQRVWYLNFDADEELARPIGYAPNAAVAARLTSLVERLDGLVPAGDVILAPSNPVAESLDGGFEGRAFCPTPRAIVALRRAGAAIPPSPPLDVLQRVNHRAFSAELGQHLPGARFVHARAELVEALSSSRGPWVLKRAFGFAGRGRQRLRSNELGPSVEPFVRASLTDRGGLQVEPWVERVIDIGMHGFLSRRGSLTLGDPTLQIVDETGAWSKSSRLPADLLTAGEERALFTEAERTAAALASAGYFGPFGIDAFRWKDAGGDVRFNPRCEVNARYSMGWAVGMGSRRPDLLPVELTWEGR
ncbi:MAG TPA: hypothetical protein VF881_18200 [Polyangiaceae bacterium]